MTLHLLQTLIHHYDNRERVSHGSQLNVISVGGKFNFPSCSRQTPWSRALTPILTRVFYMLAPPKKKLPKVDRSVRRKEKHGRRNDSFPCVCTPPFMFTVISCKIYSIYFDYKRLKFMLLRNEICKKKSSRLIFL